MLVQLSIDTLCGSLVLPAGLKVCMRVSGDRLSICFPTHFIICDDKDVSWTRLKETDGYVAIFPT